MSAAKRGFPFSSGSLLLLCLVPALGGLSRLAMLLTGAEISPENARFFEAPLPVVVHILTSLIFSVVGIHQLFHAPPKSDASRHRRLGRMLVVCGLLASLSGLWMTLFYPTASLNFDGEVLYGIRLLVGIGMIFAILRGVRCAYIRDFSRHGNWMIRAYALGLGAGTQVFTHIPWFVFPDLRSELLRTLCMGAGWFINILVAEYVIVRRSRRQTVVVTAR